MCLNSSGGNNETHISTKQFASKAHPWFSQPHANQGRPQGLKPPSAKREKTAGSLSRGLVINNCLPRNRIIKARKDFLRVYNDGLSVNGRFVKMFYLQSEPNRDFLFGITTTRKIGKAVVRNRSRRLVKEAIRKRLKWLKKGFLAVFVVKRNFVGRSYEEIEQDLENVMRRAGLFQD